MQTIFSWPFLGVLAAVLLFGALGGLVSELVTNAGNVEIPHRSGPNDDPPAKTEASPAFLQDLGVWARIIIGALAGAASLFIATGATDSLRLVSTALIAGSVGTAFFRSLQNRALALQADKNTAIAEKNAAVAQTGLAQVAAKLEDGLKTAQAGAAKGALESGGMAVPQMAEAERVMREARAIAQAYQAQASPPKERR